MPGFTKTSEMVLKYLMGTFGAGGVATFAGDIETAGLSLICLIKDFDITKTVKVADSRALCEENEANVPMSVGGQITFTAMIPAGTAGGSFIEKQGLPMKFSAKASSSVTTPSVFYGVITGVGMTGSQDDFLTEKVTVTLGIRVAA